MPRPRGSAAAPPEARIRRITEGWFITEPLLFATFLTHRLAERPGLGGLRAGAGRIEYDPAFIAALPDRALAELLRVEAVRIVLKHPYVRRPATGEIAYLASNVTLHEHVPTWLPLPSAEEVFGDASLARQYFELYCDRLVEKGRGASAGAGASSAADGAAGADGSPEAAIGAHLDPARGPEATALWRGDSLLREQLDAVVREADQVGGWGSLPGSLVAQIRASLKPKLDYRKVLRLFRTSVLASRRELTRMKPSRRYGFLYMGSRHRLRTRILIAVDVSGSISDDDLDRAFSAVNRLFQYGVESIDVVQFDTEIKGPVVTLRRRRPRFAVTGRGGTSFAPVLAYVDEHPDYDGLVIITDGIAPRPDPPRNRRTRVLWLFHHEGTYARMHEALAHVGPAAYLKPDVGGESPARRRSTRP